MFTGENTKNREQCVKIANLKLSNEKSVAIDVVVFECLLSVDYYKKGIKRAVSISRALDLVAGGKAVWPNVFNVTLTTNRFPTEYKVYWQNGYFGRQRLVVYPSFGLGPISFCWEKLIFILNTHFSISSQQTFWVSMIRWHSTMSIIAHFSNNAWMNP